MIEKQLLLLEHKPKTEEEESPYRVLDLRRIYTPDWPELKDYEYVFIPTSLGQHLKQHKLFAKGFSGSVLTNRVYYMGQGITQFSSYALRSNPTSIDDQYFMKESDNSRKGSVVGEIFALDKFQLHILDHYYTVYMNTKRSKVIVQFLDQRNRANMKLMPVQIVWSYVSDPDSIIDSHLLPYPSRTIHNKIKEFVYMI